MSAFVALLVLAKPAAFSDAVESPSASELSSSLIVCHRPVCCHSHLPCCSGGMSALAALPVLTKPAASSDAVESMSSSELSLSLIVPHHPVHCHRHLPHHSVGAPAIVALPFPAKFALYTGVV